MATGAPDYFKRILLYGIHNGVPVPAMVDEHGRFIFVAETFSRWRGSGRVLLEDDFSEGLTKIREYTSGAGASVELDYTEALRGGVSCKLIGGSTLSRMAYIYYYVHPSAFNRLGVEAGVRFNIEIETVTVQIAAYTGAKILEGQVRWTFPGMDWEIYDYASSAWVVIAENVVYNCNPHEFIPFKLTVDLEAETYHKFRLLWTDIDLSEYALYSVASTEPGYAIVMFQVVSRAAVNGFCLLDNVFITQDES